MAEDVTKIMGGPASVKMGSSGSEAVIGHTTGGVEATISPQNRERIVDEYGSSAVAVIHTGDEVRITVPWSEWTQTTVNEIYDPGVSAGGDAWKGVGRSAGYIYTTTSMIVLPYLAADAAKYLEFYKVTPVGEVSLAANNDDDRLMEVEYAALVEADSGTDGQLIGKLHVPA